MLLPLTPQEGPPPCACGVKANSPRGSVIRRGFDRDNLPEADKWKMTFGSGSDLKTKVWRDIWSASQGVGNIHEVLSTGELVARMVREYEDTRRRLCAGAG